MKALLYLILSVTLTQAAFSREILFYFFQPESTSPKEALLVGKKGSVPVKLPKRKLSNPVKLPSGDLQLALVSSQSDAKGIPDGAPTISIPKTITRAIVIVTVDSSNPIFPVKPVVIDASNKAFPLGSTKMFNFSDYDVVGKFGVKEVSVKSKKQARFTDPREGKGSYPVYIDYVKDGEKKPIFRGYWRHYHDCRQILFVVEEENRPRPRVFSVVDRNFKATKDKEKQTNAQ